MDSESGIFSMIFDQSGSRLITTEADKTIKIYKEDDTAVSIQKYRLKQKNMKLNESRQI
jgi:WD40 repeat protein